MHRVGRASGRLLAIGAIAAAAATAPADPPAGPLRFRELSTLSGGPLAFPARPSTVEKNVCAFFDADGDGWDDLLWTTGVGHPFEFWRNVPDGTGGRTFEPFAPGHGLDTGACYERDGAAVTAGDIDNDGDVDLFVGMGWSPLLAAGENALLLNDGNGKFTDVTAVTGVSDGDNTTCGAVFFDFDLDGDLDLLLSNTNFPGAGKFGNGRDTLFRNMLVEEGALRFEDVTAESGIRADGVAVWAVSAVDHDLDGDGDLLITHDIAGKTHLFRNDGGGTFTEITGTVGGGQGDDAYPSTFGDDSPNAMGVDWGDVNNDGHLDLYITDIISNALYMGGPGGRLTEKGETAGVRAGLVTWGCTFADFDLDGFLDLHVASGDTYFGNRPEIRSWLYRNRGDGTFDEVFAGSGLRHDPYLNREDGTAVSDFDRDGRVDLLSTRAYRDEPGATPYLYRNITNTGSNRWISIEVRGNGTTSNRSAIGAHLRIVPRGDDGAPLAGLGQMRQIVSQASRNSVSSFTQVVGLGPLAASVDVEITWPRAGAIRDRRDLHVALPVPPDGRLVFHDDLPPYPHAEPASTAAVARLSALDHPVSGAGSPGAPPSCVLEGAPDWVSVAGSAATGWRLLGTPPADAPDTVMFDVLLHDPSVPGSGTRQRVTVHVIDPMEPAGLRVKGGGRRLIVDLREVPDGGLAATVDGFFAAVVKVTTLKRPTRSGVVARATIAAPFATRAEWRGAHLLRIWPAGRPLDAAEIPYGSAGARGRR